MIRRPSRTRTPKAIAAAMALLALAACSGSADEEIAVGIVGTPASVFADGIRLSPAAQTYRAAVADGLVGLDENASAVPALAESWIVTDDGRSYIFRLRNGQFGDGEPVTARAVAGALERRIMALSGTSLGRDLAIVDEVRAMAGRVVEIRLKAPMPQFLVLLAQPELAISDGDSPRGAMTAERSGGEAMLAATDPQLLGMPLPRRWEDMVRPVRLVPVDAARGVEMFSDGALDVLLGGTIATYPLAPSGTLSRGTVRLDAAQGLFGIRVLRPTGFLALPQGREALSMTIDRDGLIEGFNLSGWTPRAVPVPADLSRLDASQQPGWTALTLDQRREVARRRLAQWRSANGESTIAFTIAMPRGPGAEQIFNALAGDFAAIGVPLRRAAEGQTADLVLVDRVARYPAARWYLNQLACGAGQGACSGYADSLVDEALAADTDAEYERLLREAEAELTAAEVFINLGQPLRWSLARAAVTGFAPNAAGFHPLPPLGVVPN